MAAMTRLASPTGRPLAAAVAGTPSLIDALRDPACYPHPVDRVEVLETHISWVLLAGEFAYKVKKPIRLPFLDFSTPALRRHYCEEEVRLNRRTAPGVYLGIVPIGGDAASPRVGVDEPLLETAVKMQRFRRGALLEDLARGGSLDGGMVDALADAIARFHASAAVAEPARDFGCPERVTAPAMENFKEIEALAPPPSSRERLRVLRAWTRTEGEEIGEHLAHRKRDGFVRECHGDLHLGNVVMLDARPVLFDAIEFAAKLRWIDVMSDVAFTTMDLFRHGLPRLAWRFLNRYLEATGDYEGLAVLRYYMVYRAVVRAKIAFIRASQAGGEAAMAQAYADFEAYVALAQRLSSRPALSVIAMHGLAGTGKTTASERLAEALGAVRLRSDVERKRLHGLAALERAAAPPGEGLYAADATRQTYERLEMLARECLAAGYPVIVDATFLERGRRDAFRRVAAQAGAAFELASCSAPDHVLRDRLARRAAQADDASDAGVAVLDAQLRAQDLLAPEERIQATLLDMASIPEWHGAVESLARRFRSRTG